MDVETARPPASSATSRLTSARPERVWAVLADGWTYAGWVVGSSRIRAVEPAFPAVGAALHHSFGLWPAVVDDRTVCREVDPGRRLVLEARGWPVGEAVVDISIEPHEDGARIVIAEDASAGPGQWLVPPPVRRRLIRLRNVETLRRLAFMAERRTGP